MAGLVPVVTAVGILVDWSAMPEFKESEIYCYIYICTLVHLHVVLWFCMCCSVATTTRHLMNMLRKVRIPFLFEFTYSSINSNEFNTYLFYIPLQLLGVKTAGA
jgi:hypothetical protein